MNCEPSAIMEAAKCFRCIPKGKQGNVFIYLLCQVANASASPVVPPEPPGPVENALVTDWAGRVVTNGGADPSAETRAALSTFADTLDTELLTDKMLAVNCFVPDNLIAALTPLIAVAGNDPWTNNGPYVGADLTVDGLRGSSQVAFGKFLDTGFVPSTDFADSNSAGYSSYSKTFAGSVSEARMLCWNGAGQMAGFLNDAASLNQGAFGAWNFTTAEPAWPFNTFYFQSVDRTSANDVANYMANSVQGFTTQGSSAINATGARPAFSMYLNCNNVAGAVGFRTNADMTWSFAAIHLGLSAAETEALYDAVQVLRTALGGGYA